MITADHAAMRRAMRISVSVGLLMLIIKFTAYAYTGSAAILSDAAESIVHIIAVIFAAYSLWLSLKPADEQHPYGHAKISFFSAGVEGALIVMAALYIIYVAITDWVSGLALRNLDLGVVLTALAAGINAGLGYYLVRIGKRKKSLILEANGQHVLTDSWTSAGVVIGLLLAWTTGWLFLDPLCAILVALNIIYSGVRLLQRSVGGLMDEADPAIQRRLIALLDRECRSASISHHQMRQRFNGFSYDVDVHLVFPDHLPIKDAHRIATGIENAIQRELPPAAHVTTHLEPREDHRNIHPGSPAGPT
ncbi:MAG TPA: cation diffusion facilitator family transporter [Kiritimatiellia bacterium]|nr:cation diffusion facilitator family transporter [Kiritimatiellia bacterium]HMO99825.1 cation diffusion facilitator family transporter [Kiritimatiellia bacterium]HMP97303.1 cation diffusion facilitator family transporter [Kiritimatiellia bacterium]